MAGGGNYVRPSQTWRELYNEKKPDFEIAAFLLVLAGLFLNLETRVGLLGQTIHYLQFFILILGVLMILGLLGSFMSHFLALILAVAEEAKKLDYSRREIQEFRSLSFVFFVLLIIAFFILTLFITIYLMFIRETSFLLLVIVSFLICYLTVLKVRRPEIIIIMSIVFLWLIVPIPLFIWLLYPDLPSFTFEHIQRFLNL